MTARRALVALVLVGWAVLLIPTRPADLCWPLAVGWLALDSPRMWRYAVGRAEIRRLTHHRVKEHA